jgi:hypothetical protein
MLIKGDKILIATLICMSFIFWLALNKIDKNIDPNAYVQINIDGVLYEKSILSTDKIITVRNGDDFNIVEIKDKKVKIIDSSCDNKYCVKHGYISTNKASIVCLPNRVSVEIKSTKKSNMDAIAE